MVVILFSIDAMEALCLLLLLSSFSLASIQDLRRKKGENKGELERFLSLPVGLQGFFFFFGGPLPLSYFLRQGSCGSVYSTK